MGDDYVNGLFRVWGDRVRPEADLCCYWFEKARAMVSSASQRRAGLLATQGIRGGANRETLARIKRSGDIFFAIGDRDWVLDGANVHISMVGFDNGTETERSLDGRPVETINSNLTASADVTRAQRLPENLRLSFMGDTKGGPFDVPLTTALELLQAPNVSGGPSSDVVVPWCNGLDVTRRGRDMWIIDFGVDASAQDASLYDGPFEYTRRHVFDLRQKNKRESYKSRWWVHVESRPAMREALEDLDRFIVTPTVSKHRLFVWMSSPTLPDHQLIAIARADDYFFGVLHSRVHEAWARAQGTQVRERESGFRYTPTSCFETFPLPEPNKAQRDVIAAAAKQLDKLRSNWLNPPEWTKTENLEFRGSAVGPWQRYVQKPDSRGIGTVRYPRTVPRDAACAAKLAARTLTNLYNQRPQWLIDAHRDIDEAVCAVYGWESNLSDEEIVRRLLEENQGRSRTTSTAPSVALRRGGA